MTVCPRPAPSSKPCKPGAKSDARFREALPTNGIETLLSGDIDTGKALLRDYININATIGFGPLAEAIGAEPRGRPGDCSRT
jgi:hypothetical protein